LLDRSLWVGTLGNRRRVGLGDRGVGGGLELLDERFGKQLVEATG